MHLRHLDGLASLAARSTRRTFCAPPQRRKRPRSRARRTNDPDSPTSAPAGGTAPTSPSKPQWLGLVGFRYHRMRAVSLPPLDVGLSHALRATLSVPHPRALPRTMALLRAADLPFLPTALHADAIRAALRAAAATPAPSPPGGQRQRHQTQTQTQTQTQKQRQKKRKKQKRQQQQQLHKQSHQLLRFQCPEPLPQLHTTLTACAHADLAAELLVRVSAAAPHTSAAALREVVRAAARDPDPARRAARAASILRFAQSKRVDVREALLADLFQLFISVFDLQSAGALLQHASSPAHTSSSSSSSSPTSFSEAREPPTRLAALHDSLAHAALLLDQHFLVASALRARAAVLAAPNALSRGVELALAVDLGAAGPRAVAMGMDGFAGSGGGGMGGLSDEEAQLLAEIGIAPMEPRALLDTLREHIATGRAVHAIAFAYLLRHVAGAHGTARTAGGQASGAASGNVPGVWETFEAFEESQRVAGASLSDSLSETSRSLQTSLHALSAESGLFAQGDPVFAAFNAFRSGSDVDGAVRLARHLRDAHGFVLPPLLFSVVFETCCKAGKADLVGELRREGFGGDCLEEEEAD